MSIHAVTFTVAEPSAVAARLGEAFGWTVSEDFGAFAEVTTGSSTIWLNVPSESMEMTVAGCVLHVQVADVEAATERARAAGAEILREPTTMDYGAVSAYARVSGGPIVDLTRPA
jgi:predicted enzyme related to lactoylglutathione lyase